MPKSKRSQRRQADAAQPPSPSPPQRSRWLKRAALLGLLAVVVLVGMVWWQERALSQAAEALDEGETKYAMYLVSKFLENHPTHSRALAIQARGLVTLGYPDETIQIFDRIGAASVEDMHALARAYMLRGEWSSGQRLLSRVLQLKPDDADARYELASCQMRLGDFAAALENAHNFARQPGQAARGQVMVGSIHGDMRNDRAAAEAFAKVLQESPGARNLQISPAEFYLRYGRVLLRLGKPRESLEPLKLSVAGQPMGEAFALLGEAASQLGQPENAKVAWEQAVKVEADNFAARTSLANLAMLSGDGQAAIDWLAPIAGSNDLPARAAYLMQRGYAQLGDDANVAVWQEKTAALRRDEEHLATLENALISQPKSFWSRTVRAHRFAKEGNWLQADLIVDGLVQEAPGEPFIIELTDAVRRRSSELPALSRIPVTDF